MIQLQTKHKGQKLWGHLFLLFLAALCVSTVIESVPEREDGFFGHDFYTISGLKSTTEVFRRGGTYILHNYSALAPGCDGCESIQIQADFGVPNMPQGADFFNRMAPQAIEITTAASHSEKLPRAVMHAPSSNVTSPESPPPRSR